MNVDTLIANLKNPQPETRLDVIRVLGMVEETRALDALRHRLGEETLPALKENILWAGRRINAAAQRGHTTQDAIFQYFGIDREIENTQDDPEAELLRKMDENLQLDLMRRQREANKKKTNLAAGAMLATAALGATGVPVPSATMGGMLQAGAETASSNLGQTRPQIGTSRTPAMRPTGTDIALWLKRLEEGQDLNQRINASQHLREINNPAALPHLARIVMGESAPDLRQAAEKAGKHLYWNAVYWQMEQDGSLATEMDARRKALGKTAPAPAASQTPVESASESQPPEQSPENVAEILRRANEARQRRKKNRGK